MQKELDDLGDFPNAEPMDEDQATVVEEDTELEAETAAKKIEVSIYNTDLATMRIFLVLTAWFILII